LDRFKTSPAIQTQDPEWYAALTANLTEQQLKSLNEVAILAAQRAAAKESKRIEQQGGMFVCFLL